MGERTEPRGMRKETLREIEEQKARERGTGVPRKTSTGRWGMPPPIITRQPMRLDFDPGCYPMLFDSETQGVIAACS